MKAATKKGEMAGKNRSGKRTETEEEKVESGSGNAGETRKAELMTWSGLLSAANWCCGVCVCVIE